MATFTLTIECDNAAFVDDGEAGQGALPEVGRILGVLSRKLQGGDGFHQRTSGGLLDGNGNKVGIWQFGEE